MGDIEVGKRQIQSVVAGHVAGVRWGQRFIAREVLQPVNTYGEKFIYETRGNEALQDIDRAKRAINGDTAVVDLPENSTKEGSLDEWALQGKIDYRLLHADKVADLVSNYAATNGGLSRADNRRLGLATNLMEKIKLQEEKAAASIVFGTGSYISALTWGAGLGDAAIDFAAAGIIGKIAEIKRAVARLFGYEPDTLTLGYTKYLNLWTNPDFLARVTGGANNQNPADVNLQLIAGMFGVKKIVVASAVIQPKATPGEAAASATDVWTPTSASLNYTGVDATQDLQSPAFGKTFYMDVPETNVPVDVRTWMSDNGKIESMEVTQFATPTLTMKCGALFTA